MILMIDIQNRKLGFAIFHFVFVSNLFKKLFQNYLQYR